jgi:hypothetical protein
MPRWPAGNGSSVNKRTRGFRVREAFALTRVFVYFFGHQTCFGAVCFIGKKVKKKINLLAQDTHCLVLS